MASEAQVLANRRNAEKSTGPRTVAGKAVVAQNALKHGLLAEQVVIRGEDPGQFEFYRDQMLGELAPAGPVESMLAERAVGLAWRLRRAERIQAEVFDALMDAEMNDPARRVIRSLRSRVAKGDEAPGDSRDLTLGRVVARDFGHSRTLDRLGLYERRIEHSLYKTMGELQRLRLLRELDGPAEKPTPEPVCPADGKRSCETNPISAVSARKTPVVSQREAQLVGVGMPVGAGCSRAASPIDPRIHRPDASLCRGGDLSTLRGDPGRRLSAR